MDQQNPESPQDPPRRDGGAPKTSGVPHPGRGAPPADEASALVVVVTVTRTGGFAGIRRKWRAEAGEDKAPTWISLIEECPWDAVPLRRSPEGVDRFVWDVDARCGEDERQAALAESEVQGPWRALIDAVREAGAPVPR